MAEPFILALLPEDAEIADVARQFVNSSGPVYDQFIQACKVLAE